jgi:hypothetical protein
VAGQQIEADLSGLTQAAAAVQTRCDAIVRERMEELFSSYRLGVNFGPGWWPSGYLCNAQDYCHGSMVATTKSLSLVVQEAQTIVGAVGRVVTNYRSSDVLAAASGREIAVVLINEFDRVRWAAFQQEQAAAERAASQPKGVQ